MMEDETPNPALVSVLGSRGYDNKSPRRLPATRADGCRPPNAGGAFYAPTNQRPQLFFSADFL
jgi:hypothetical protein